MGFNWIEQYPTDVEIAIKLANPMVRDWAILSNRPISLLEFEIDKKMHPT